MNGRRPFPTTSNQIVTEPTAKKMQNGHQKQPDHTAGLTAQEQLAFDGLKRLCEARGLTKRPAGLAKEDVSDGLNDDATLLRFLKARQFSIDAAMEQFQESWAIRTSVDAIRGYDTIDVDIFESIRHMYPHWSGRRDKRGLPICLFDTTHLNADALARYSKQRAASGLEATRQAIVFHDYLTRFVLPLCSSAAGRPISSAVYLCDVGTLTLRQTWSVRGYAQDISQLLATCYPEVIDRVYVLNASAYFARIWAVIKKWVDPRTAAKLVIVQSSEVMDTLLESMDIEDIPKQYGGRFEAKHRMVPRLDEETRQGSGCQGAVGEEVLLPRGPIKWVVDSIQVVNENGNRNSVCEKKVAVAVGTQNGKDRKEIVARHGRAETPKTVEGDGAL
ncbi:CRAL-TRIO domain-containing protein [Rhypophila decipiens]|uniref:CRAL-TRIO domain-containing protein n=1 Tax=Rhypophila decipiens TaxID=261697 RepID=A0AAN6YAZ0_9PEZI|nr:CRAL-TRIO domain-containing protein [Rhypophila decipiens]